MNKPITMTTLLDRLNAQDALNQETVALQKEVTGLLKQLTAEQRHQGELIAKVVAWIASQPQ